MIRRPIRDINEGEGHFVYPYHLGWRRNMGEVFSWRGTPRGDGFSWAVGRGVWPVHSHGWELALTSMKTHWLPTQFLFYGSERVNRISGWCNMTVICLLWNFKVIWILFFLYNLRWKFQCGFSLWSLCCLKQSQHSTVYNIQLASLIVKFNISSSLLSIQLNFKLEIHS